MFSKSDIVDYLDKGNKGYISLCDLCRILFHCIIWIVIYNAPIIVLAFQGKVPNDITLLDIILFNGICWVVEILLIVSILLIVFCIIHIIKSKVFKCITYNKLKTPKTKLCKIKLLKLK